MMRPTRANKPSGYLLGSYRIATAPELMNSPRRMVSGNVEAGHRADAASYVGFARDFRAPQQKDTAGEVSRRDGWNHAVDGVGVVDRAVLPEGR